MDGLGTLIGLLLWGLMAAAGAIKRNADKAQAGPPGLPSSPQPPPPPLPQDQRRKHELAKISRRSANAAGMLEEARALSASAEHAELSATVQAAQAEVQELHRRVETAGPEPPAGALRALSVETQRLHQRAVLLKRLVEARTDAKTGPETRRLASAVQAALPDLSRLPLVFRGSDGDRGVTTLEDTELLPLSLTGNPRRRPWVAAALIEDAWAGELIADQADQLAAMSRAAGLAAGDDAMGRFASGLTQAWAPALLLDAACTLSLAGGHAARVRALAEQEPTEELFVVRIDAQQRVGASPPAGLRQLLLRKVLERVGGPSAPPLPPGLMLHLRGPGIWDQVPLQPVLDHLSEVQALFTQDLSQRRGLEDPAGIERQARELLGQVESAPANRGAEARVLFAAFGLSAASNAEPERNDRLFSALGAEPARTPDAPAARQPLTRRAAARAGRKRVLREALLLGEAFAGRRA